MGLFDSITNLFSKAKGADELLNTVKDGKLDASALKDQAMNQLDSNGDGTLDAKDLDINQDGKTDLDDFESIKNNLPFPKK